MKYGYRENTHLSPHQWVTLQIIITNLTCWCI